MVANTMSMPSPPSLFPTSEFPLHRFRLTFSVVVLTLDVQCASPNLT